MLSNKSVLHISTIELRFKYFFLRIVRPLGVCMQLCSEVYARHQFRFDSSPHLPRSGELLSYLCTSYHTCGLQKDRVAITSIHRGSTAQFKASITDIEKANKQHSFTLELTCFIFSLSTNLLIFFFTAH